MSLRMGLKLLTAAVVIAVVGGSALLRASSPVADAAKRGDREAVRALIQQGADVNAAHGDGMTPLHWAAERGDAEMAAMLLAAGATPAAVTRLGQYTPLHLASRNGNAAVVAALLKAGADASARTTTSGVAPIHLAAASGNPEVVKLLLDHGADPNAKEGQWEQTPLIFAAAENRVEVINLLIARGARPNLPSKTVDMARQQQLDRAASQLQRRVLETSVPQGQDPTPSQLQGAIQAGRELYASGKIPPPDPNQPAGGGRGRFGGGNAPAAGGDPNAAAGARGRGGANPADPLNDDGPAPAIAAKGGMTPLLHAARQGHVEAVRALLDAGADINQTGAGDEVSPLLMAAINGQFDVAMLLIERGADPNLRSKSNDVTPLWATINAQWQPRTRYPQPQEMERQKASYLDVMEALLKAGADPNARTRAHPWYLVYTGCGNGNCGLTVTTGSTAFWRAAYGTDVDAMRLLVKYGADPNIPTIVQGGRGGFGGRGGRGGDPAGRGAPQGGAPGFDGTQPTPAQDPSGLPPVTPGGPGVYPIHAASGVEYGEGFAGNAHRHAPDGWLPAVKYLIEELGADVNARDDGGYTALHHAAARGDNELILYLVSKGADVTVVSRRDQTVADMANGPVQRVSPFPATVALLEKLGSKNNHRCVTC